MTKNILNIVLIMHNLIMAKLAVAAASATNGNFILTTRASLR